MSTPHSDFDARALTWDDDPMKTARANAVAKGIRTGVSLAPTMKGLEFGCGTGLLSFALRNDLQHITLADTSDGMLGVLREKIASNRIAHMTPVRIEENGSEFATQSFDLIYSLMTLHHIRDTRAILRSFYDWLAPGGHLCIADLDAEDGSFHNHDTSVHNGFERQALVELVTAAGFDTVRFSTVFRIQKGTPEKEYPVFLMIADKRHPRS